MNTYFLHKRVTIDYTVIIEAETQKDAIAQATDKGTGQDTIRDSMTESQWRVYDKEIRSK